MTNGIPVPDPANIQGLILRGYTHPFSCHLLFSFKGPQGAPVQGAALQGFFARLYPSIRSGADWGSQKPLSMLNMGFTYNGLRALAPGILQPSEISQFSPPFVAGPAGNQSQQSLDDTGASAPARWWNGQGDTVNRDLHLVVHVYGLTEAALDTLLSEVAAAAEAAGITELKPLAGGRLYQSIVDGDPDKIHFGYTDGISEPPLVPPTEGRTPDPGDLANFLIGYNAYSVTQTAPSAPGAALDFARDGSYNAFRVLYQDVAAFNAFLEKQTEQTRSKLSVLGMSDEAIGEWLAAKLVGRWRNGSPLMLNPDVPGTDPSGEDFGYADGSYPPAPKGALAAGAPVDKDLASGLRCPFSAHTRVANPRDQALSPFEDASPPSRIVRRGMPYGASLNGTADDGGDRGLVGLFLCGSFADQFERIYSWMNYNTFSPPPLFPARRPPQDALLGDRNTANPMAPGAVTSFRIPMTAQASDDVVLTGLPQFLVTRGTAYCLLPSMTALRRIAGLTQATN